MTEEFQPRDPQRFEAAVRRFDEENARDPNIERVAGVAHPRELIYAQWLTEWVLKLCPEASEPLRLAARCQHLCRWLVPRTSSPMTAGYPEELIARVQALNLKKGLPQDPEVQVLEDALCLVFLEHQFSDLASKSADDKMVNVLRKTWAKMTPAAHALVLTMAYDPRGQALLDKALKPADEVGSASNNPGSA